jgi:hypothetical protein
VTETGRRAATGERYLRRGIQAQPPAPLKIGSKAALFGEVVTAGARIEQPAYAARS